MKSSGEYIFEYAFAFAVIALLSYLFRFGSDDIRQHQNEINSHNDRYYLKYRVTLLSESGITVGESYVCSYKEERSLGPNTTYEFTRRYHNSDVVDTWEWSKTSCIIHKIKPKLSTYQQYGQHKH